LGLGSGESKPDPAGPVGLEEPHSSVEHERLLAEPGQRLRNRLHDVGPSNDVCRRRAERAGSGLPAARYRATASSTPAASTPAATSTSTSTSTSITSTTASATSAAATTPDSLPRAEGARTATGSCQAEDPAATLLGRSGRPCSLEAVAARPRDRAVATAWSAQAAGLPGQASGRPAVGDGTPHAKNWC